MTEDCANASRALRIMTLNIRRQMPLSLRPADRWRVRRDRMRTLLQSERPTVLATQEVMPGQARWLLDALGASYRFIGRGRGTRGIGEGCPVFFDADRLELLDWQQHALSDTPHVEGSRSWGNLFPRVFVAARFRERVTSGQFRLINTHLDPLCRRSQIKSVAAIRSYALREDATTVITGDFNAGPGSRPMEMLLDGRLRDAWLHARHRATAEFSTYAKYRRPRPGTRIDWIVTSANVTVEKIAILARPIDGGWPSDHLPVQAELTFATRKDRE